VVPTRTPTNTPTNTAVVPTPTSTGTVVAPTSTPTEVLVVAFSGARVARSRVLLRWRTASELNLLGFNVYCGAKASQRVRRNSHLILARRGVHRYSFGDRIARKVRRPGPYWLQIVDPQGNKSWFGSVVIH
jgi:hypothetical protein